MRRDWYGRPLVFATLKAISVFIDLATLPVFVLVAVFSRVARLWRSDPPRIVWGSTGLINNVSWSKAMRDAGYRSTTFVFSHYSINRKTDFDRVLLDEYRWCPLPFRPYLAFMFVLARCDVLVTSVRGFMLVTPVLRRLQAGFFRLAGVRTVVIPFGGDAYIYSRIRSTGLLQGLLFSYPEAAREQRQIARDVDYWCERADVMIPGVIGIDGLGRWDVPVSSSLSVDLDVWMSKTVYSQDNGTKGPVVVGHAPNHRGFKGTEFVIDAVRRLQDEGLKVELRLIEGVTNDEVRRILHDEVDILVAQLIFTGHGMNELEGMALGLPVVCNLEDEQYLLPFRRWSFFGECPLISADPESLPDVLRHLVVTPEIRETLGRLGRAYVEKFHGLDSSQYLFGAVFDYLFDRRESLSDLYHPLTSEFVNRSPKIVVPLDRNRLQFEGNK